MFNILSHIHAYVYHKHSDTLNAFNMPCPLSKAKVIFKGSSLNQFFFPMLDGTLSSLQKYLFLLLNFSFVLFTVHVVKMYRLLQNYLPKIILLQNIFCFNSISSIIVIRYYFAYDMFNGYHHAYQINQENVQKSLFKALFIFMKFQTPSPFYPP